MTWVNYHTHCHFCDGKNEPEAYVLKAVEKGFPALGFSSHAPLPFITEWNMKPESMPEYVREISRLKEKYKDTIQIYLGLEVDYINDGWGFHSSFFNSVQLDYCIGSVHFLDPYPDGTPWSFDGAPDEFFRGFGHIYNNDSGRLVKRYYEQVRAMVMKDHPDVIGHLDKIKMHNTHRLVVDEESVWYREYVEETLDLIAAEGCIVEINTRGLYRHNQAGLYPGKWMLERIRHKKIPVMINADAHLADEIDAGFVYAAELLESIGIQSLKILLNNQWRECTLTRCGIEI